MHALILQAENRLLQAIQTGNIAALDQLLHDDLRFIIPTGDTITKAEDLAHYQRQRLEIESLEIEEQTTQMVSTNGLSLSIIRLKGIFAGQAFAGRFKYLRVWQNGPKGWQVIGGAGISLPEESA